MKKLDFLGIFIFFGCTIMHGMENYSSLRYINEAEERFHSLPARLMQIIDGLSIVVNSPSVGEACMLTTENIKQIEKILHKNESNLSVSEKNLLNVFSQFPTILMNELIKALPVDSTTLLKYLPNDDQLKKLCSFFENFSPVIAAIMTHSSYSFSPVVKKYLPFTYFAVTGEKYENCCICFANIDHMFANAYFMKHGQFIKNCLEKSKPFNLTLLEIEQLKKIIQTDSSCFAEIKEKFINQLPNLLIQNVICALPLKVDPTDGKEKKFLNKRASKKLRSYYQAISLILCAPLHPNYEFSLSFKKYLPLTYLAVIGEKYQRFSDFTDIDYMLANTYLADYSSLIKNVSEKNAPFGLTHIEIKQLTWIINTDDLCFAKIKEHFIEPLPNTLIQKATEKDFLRRCEFEKLYDYFKELTPVLCAVLSSKYAFSFSFKTYLPQTYYAITEQECPLNVKVKFKDIDLMLKNEYLHHHQKLQE